MSLQTMLIKLGEATGQQPTSADARAQLTRYINTAGREIWSARDLPTSTFEQFFTMPTAVVAPDGTPDIQLTLPWYCEGIRAVRWADMGQKIRLQDTRPRYQAAPWRQPFLTWRIRASIPLHTAPSSAGALTFTLPTAQTVPVIITVTGPSTTASSAYEAVTIVAGALTATTTTQWDVSGPTAITKNATLTCDVGITDVDGNTVGLIPARQERAANILVQIADEYAPYQYIYPNTVEVLYKLPYQELAFDGDVFVNTAYEDALIWRARANWAALQSNEMAVQSAALFAAKSDELIAQLAANQESSVEMNMNYAPNPYANLGPYMRWGRVRRGINYVSR